VRQGLSRRAYDGTVFEVDGSEGAGSMWVSKVCPFSLESIIFVQLLTSERKDRQVWRWMYSLVLHRSTSSTLGERFDFILIIF